MAALYLDQGFAAGIGNSLRSEILFAARCHPDLRPLDLTAQQRPKLAQQTLKISCRSGDTGGMTNLASRVKSASNRVHRLKTTVAAFLGVMAQLAMSAVTLCFGKREVREGYIGVQPASQSCRTLAYRCLADKRPFSQIQSAHLAIAKWSCGSTPDGVLDKGAAWVTRIQIPDVYTVMTRSFVNIEFVLINLTPVQSL